MVKSMINYDKLKSKIETIFRALRVEYSILELQDNDLNYSIQINTIGKLKPLNSISCIFYLCEFDMSINLIVGNIYRANDDDNLLFLYKVINEINMYINNGNFTLINDSPKQIFYKSSLNCGTDFSNLNDELVKYQLNVFISALERLLDSLKNGITEIV